MLGGKFLDFFWRLGGPEEIERRLIGRKNQRTYVRFSLPCFDVAPAQRSQADRDQREDRRRAPGSEIARSLRPHGGWRIVDPAQLPELL